ncbi:MAG: secondary thiamine-phosphate synthase enzyme YjbQ [Gammaproteobacteria bacterium]|nr:secondary thiamine-phosphate synthase enzyme YjbQ [Gammaproteobacteria bacterium]
MSVQQFEILLNPRAQGMHLVTNEVFDQIPGIASISSGLLHIFIQHSSASISINEWADPDVRQDLENFYAELCNNKSYYMHTAEGLDDMPSHVKASMLGSSISIPITSGRANLGVWQGVILGEHRIQGGSRKLIVTLIH